MPAFVAVSQHVTTILELRGMFGDSSLAQEIREKSGGQVSGPQLLELLILLHFTRSFYSLVNAIQLFSSYLSYHPGMVYKGRFTGSER